MKDNLGLRVLALVIAIILWSYVRVTVGGYSQNVISQLELQLPLELRGGGSNLIPYEASTDTVTLTLRGSSEVVSELREGLVRAYVDLESMVAGSHWPEVQVLVPPGIQIVGKTPASVNVKLSSPMVKEVEVLVETAGSPKKGYYAGEPIFSPKTVKLQGPEALVSQVTRVTAVVPLESIDQSISVAISNLTPVNENGTAVMGTDSTIRLTPRQVTANIPVYREQAVHNLPILLDNVKVEEREGFTFTLEVEPAFIQVRAESDDASKLPKGLKTVAVFFPSSVEPQEREVPLMPVDGLTNLGPSAVTLRLIPKEEGDLSGRKGAGGMDASKG